MDDSDHLYVGPTVGYHILRLSRVGQRIRTLRFQHYQVGPII